MSPNLINIKKLDAWKIPLDEKSPKKEIDALENTVKGILGHISGVDTSSAEKATSQLSSLESLVKGALTELTDLEGNLLELIKPSNQTGFSYRCIA